MKDSIQKERSTPVMHPTAAFLTDVGLVAVLSLALVAYVKPHLNALLMELCGTAERARFWLAFSNVTLVLEIGRASCRERVEVSVVAGVLNEKQRRRSLRS